LYDKLLDKVGTRQLSAGGRVGESFYLGLTSVFPIVGGPLVSNLLMAECDNLQIALEKTFTVNEVKEIINELGVSQINNHTEQLKKILLTVRENEQEHKEIIKDLEEKIQKGGKILSKVEKKLETEKAARETEVNNEKAKRDCEVNKLKKEIKNLTQQVAIITKSYNEEMAERYKLEKIAIETAERINNNSLLPDLTKIELHEAKQKIVQLSQVIESQKGLIAAGKISLESKEKQITG
jgi:hypothetical protein